MTLKMRLGRDRLARADRERGTVLPLVALMLVVLLGLAAFAIDVSSWYQVKRKAQATADAAALAGAQDLPYDQTDAIPDAQSYVNTNFPAASANITLPASNQVKAVVTTSAPSFFARVLGVGPMTISATAIAQADPSITPSALYAHDTSCSGGITVSSSQNLTVNGETRSNGSFTQSGSHNETFGKTTYGGPQRCPYISGGASNVTYAGAAAPTPDYSYYPWPADYTKSPPTCPANHTAASWSWTTTGSTIPSGVWCATGTITISANSITGNVTLEAGAFNITGQQVHLTPYYKNLVIYQTGSSQLNLNGNNMAGGTVFAPNATVSISGNNGNGTGFVEAQDVTMSGNNWTITGDGPPIFTGSSLIY